MPKRTSPAASKVFDVINKGYLHLAECFEKSGAAALRTETEKMREAFVEDATESIVQEMISAHLKWQIINMRDVHAKISISDIRANTQSVETGDSLESDADVESLIESMLASGMLEAKIQKPVDKPAYLEFLPVASELTEAEFAHAVQDMTQRIKALQPILKATNERLSTTSEYVKYAKRNKGAADNDINMLNNPVEDEDLLDDFGAGI